MDVTAWRTSSYSGSNGGTCIEVGTVGPSVAVRDSQDQTGPRLAFSASTWKSFTNCLKGHGQPVSAVLVRSSKPTC